MTKRYTMRGEQALRQVENSHAMMIQLRLALRAMAKRLEKEGYHVDVEA